MVRGRGGWEAKVLLSHKRGCKKHDSPRTCFCAFQVHICTPQSNIFGGCPDNNSIVHAQFLRHPRDAHVTPTSRFRRSYNVHLVGPFGFPGACMWPGPEEGTLWGHKCTHGAHSGGPWDSFWLAQFGFNLVSIWSQLFLGVLLRAKT